MLASLAAAAFSSLAGAGAAAEAQGPARDRKLLLYYGASQDDAIGEYDIAVLDSAIEELPPSCRTTLCLGYLSLGEIHGGQDYFSEIALEGLLFQANPNWPDARLVDLRSVLWRDRVVEQIVPAILARGFHGLFFDTLDSAEALEARDPGRYAGMVDGAADLVRAVRQRFPGLPLMLNRGYAVLPQIVGQFDMLLGESVRSTFEADSKDYRMTTKEEYVWQSQRMREARERDPRLQLLSLDYWDPQDPAGIARIYAEERANGFVPYVGTHDLTRIVPEP